MAVEQRNAPRISRRSAIELTLATLGAGAVIGASVNYFQVIKPISVEVNKMLPPQIGEDARATLTAYDAKLATPVGTPVATLAPPEQSRDVQAVLNRDQKITDDRKKEFDQRLEVDDNIIVVASVRKGALRLWVAVAGGIAVAGSFASNALRGGVMSRF